MDFPSLSGISALKRPAIRKVIPGSDWNVYSHLNNPVKLFDQPSMTGISLRSSHPSLVTRQRDMVKSKLFQGFVNKFSLQQGEVSSIF